MDSDRDAVHDARRWLWLGVIALAIAGIFAIVLVSARTPQLSMFTDLFSVALVVHVDLSVLLWFLAIAGMGWALLVPQAQYQAWRRAGLWTVAAATACIALSPLEPHWQVLKSNYIPVLNNLPFLLGLGLLAAGITVAIAPVLYEYRTAASRRDIPQDMQGFIYAAFTTLLALIAFFLSARFMPDDVGLQVKFETLFWAGGHILQVSYTLLMMAAWIALAELVSAQPVSPRAVRVAYAISLLAAGAHLAGFIFYPFDSPEFIFYQTQVMISFSGLGALLLFVVITRQLWQARRNLPSKLRACSAALIGSLILFAAGGVLGLLISGQNVTIPAHYHGAIVGVTLALMGLAYAMLPRFGYESVSASRLAFWQSIIYATGQLMHIGGLAYSGGYGVLRKTPGAPVEMATQVKIALGIMGFGGLLAIIGGLLFVIVMGRVLLAGASLKPPYKA